tara:strand:+ start:1820 stop:2071 length:252 start_codon:yes stop_codon:yes gene_type:complete
MLNRWISFEKDKCDACNHPKMVRLILDTTKTPLDPLRVVVSCDCPKTIFREDWKACKNLIVLTGDMTVMEMICQIGEHLGDDE